MTHFVFHCEALKDKIETIFNRLYKYTSIRFDSLPYSVKLQKIFNLDFENSPVVNTISKGIFDMYKMREKIEADRLKA